MLPFKKARISAKRILLVYLQILLIVIIIYFSYSFVCHEAAHLGACILSGNHGKIFLGFPSKTECTFVAPFNVYAFWAYNMAPYLFIALPVAVFFSLAKLKSKTFHLNILITAIPCVSLLDALVNYFLTFFYPQSDFGVILRISPWLYASGVLLVLCITLLSRYWIKNCRDRSRPEIK